jgi:hypothetical protein
MCSFARSALGIFSAAGDRAYYANRMGLSNLSVRPRWESRAIAIWQPASASGP